jgi:hypothetical protein
MDPSMVSIAARPVGANLLGAVRVARGEVLAGLPKVRHIRPSAPGDGEVLVLTGRFYGQ